MYENITVESVKADIIGRLTSALDTREGSFTNDMISAVALEISKVYQSLDAVLPIAFVDETSGEYIDKRANEYGIVRKAGTRATLTMLFDGTDGTVITAGKVFLTTDGLQFETNASVTIIGNVASVTATAEDIGAVYNVAAGEITLQLTSLSGLNYFFNTPSTGGTDAESDEALFARLQSFQQNTATSGNAAHYMQWALSVDGVGAAKVYPTWDGPGTVLVLIVGSNKEPVDLAVVSACTDYIEASRPIGATVTVMSASALNINVAATISIDSSTTIADVHTAFTKALTEYLQSIAFSKYNLVFNRIAYMLLDIPGVTDYSDLTINGGEGNITIIADEVPVIGTVVIE